MASLDNNKSKLTVVETLLATMPPSNYKITLAQLRLAAVCNRTLIARSGSNCCFFSCCGGHCAWRHDAECRLSTPSVSFTMYAKAHIQKFLSFFYGHANREDIRNEPSIPVSLLWKSWSTPWNQVRWQIACSAAFEEYIKRPLLTGCQNVFWTQPTMTLVECGSIWKNWRNALPKIPIMIHSKKKRGQCTSWTSTMTGSGVESNNIV